MSIRQPEADRRQALYDAELKETLDETPQVAHFAAVGWASDIIAGMKAEDSDRTTIGELSDALSELGITDENQIATLALYGIHSAKEDAQLIAN